jgi:hypothetical protein
MAHDPREHTPDWTRLSAAIARDGVRKKRVIGAALASAPRFVIRSAYDDDEPRFAAGTVQPGQIEPKSAEDLLVDVLVESMLDDMIRDMG